MAKKKKVRENPADQDEAMALIDAGRAVEAHWLRDALELGENPDINDVVEAVHTFCHAYDKGEGDNPERNVRRAILAAAGLMVQKEV